MLGLGLVAECCNTNAFINDGEGGGRRLMWGGGTECEREC